MGRLRRIILVGTIGAPCLLAGVVGVLALYVHSVLAPPSAPHGFTRFVPLDVYTPAGSPFSSSLSVSFDDYAVGGCLWLALGALGCAVVAAITCLVAYRTLAAVEEPRAASGRL